MIRFGMVLFLFMASCFGQNKDDFESYLQKLKDDFKIEQIDTDSLSTQDVLLLDTREKNEYRVSRIKSAIWIGYNKFDLTRLDSIDRDAEIVVYCSVGYRSSLIGLLLIKNGFRNVKNLYGGIFKWANDGHPLYNDTTQTIRIHTFNNQWGRFIQNPYLIKID